MDTIKTLVIDPLRRPELRDIDPSITAIGKTIGGYAEPLPLDRRTTLWCDGEGGDQEPQAEPHHPPQPGQPPRGRRQAHHHPRHVRHHGTPPAGRPPRTRRRADRTLRRHVRRPRSALQAPRRQNVHDTRPPHRLTHGQGVPARANQAIGDGLRRPGRATRPSRTSPRRPEPPAPTGIGLPHACGKHDGRASPIRKRNAPKGARPQVSLLAFSAEAETIIPASRNPSNRHADGLRPARSIGRNPLWPVTLRLTERPKRKNRG